jgi:hypothetical protein
MIHRAHSREKMKTVCQSKYNRARRMEAVIYAVCKAMDLRAAEMLGPQSSRDAKGTQARYAVWWVFYFRMGMTQAAIGRVFRLSGDGIAIGYRRVEPLIAEHSRPMAIAMAAADRAAASAVKKYPLDAEEAERVLRKQPVDWRAIKPTSAFAK